MDYVPITPFRRTADAAVVMAAQAAGNALPPAGVNKWEALRELAAARRDYGLSDRDLTVLQALISFHPDTILGGNAARPVVHPSNRAICERLNGMPCSTMRRHLAKLVQAGFILRRDSPNGKRYVRRYGDDKIAFGFDLSPLALRHADVCAAAEAIRKTQEAVKRLRTTISLMRRDLAGLVDYGRELHPDLPLWQQVTDLADSASAILRRKTDRHTLARLKDRLQHALDAIRDHLDAADTAELSTSAPQNEQHHQNSQKESYDLEPCREVTHCVDDAPPPIPPEIPDDRTGCAPDDTYADDRSQRPNLSLRLVLSACTEFRTFIEGPVRHWHELVRAAERIRPMIGISPSAWEAAQRAMGPEQAAVVVLAMLERFAEIRSPGGYLRTLSDKAAAGGFSCAPMVMALLRREAV